MPTMQNSLIFIGYLYGFIFALMLLRYLVICGGAAVLPRLLPRFMGPRRIRQQPTPQGQRRREAGYSLLSMGIISLVGAFEAWGTHQGYGKVYLDVQQWGLPYFWFSVLLLVLLHDTYFYWAHRLMHHPFLFPRVHRVHHLSFSPTPWAAFAFHPWEALLMAAFGPIIMFSIPIHPGAFALFLVVMTIFNAWGHLGYAILPAWFVHRWPWAMFNTAVHHAQHHERFTCNYGLYFNLWDRSLKTNHPEYFALYDQVKQRIHQELHAGEKA